MENNKILQLAEKAKVKTLRIALLILLLTGVIMAMMSVGLGESRIHKQTSSDLQRSNEILTQLDDYSYTWTRFSYQDGTRTAEESCVISFSTAEGGRVMQYQDGFEESRAVYFPDRAYSYDGEVWGILCLTLEEC